MTASVGFQVDSSEAVKQTWRCERTAEMSAITREDVIRQLRTVNDPELHKDLVTLDAYRRSPDGPYRCRAVHQM